MGEFLLAAVNAKYIHSNLAVYSLRTYAKAQGIDVDLLEFTINQNSDFILRKIFEKSPKVLFLSCYIWNISYVLEIVRDVRQILPETDIWLGGPEVSFDAVKCLTKTKEIKGILRGEGELVFTNLCKAYKEKQPFTNIKGITYRQDDQKIQENISEAVMDLSDIPFPYHSVAHLSNRIIYYESSRGCPFSCSYCLSSIDKQLRFRSLPLVCKELQYFLDNKVPQVKFVDRTFNCNKKHALAIWDYIQKHDNGVTNFHFEIAADLIDDEELLLIEKMRRGLIQLEIGVQSTNGETLQAIRRSMDFKKVCDIVTKIKGFENTHQHLDLIAGLPYEGYDSFRDSFKNVYALHPEQLQLGFLKVLKGSFMYDHISEYEGRYHAKEPYEILCTKWLNYQEVLKLKLVEEMLEVYYNSGQFVQTMLALETIYDNMFDFYLALGNYYEANGFSDVSHSRVRRFEILIAFLKATKGDTIEVKHFQIDRKQQEQTVCFTWEQLCTMDFYTRENAKSRPSFAASLDAYHEIFKDFYQKEKENVYFLDTYVGYNSKQMMRMTHMEAFRCGDTELILLFDYLNKDHLSGSAKIMDITKYILS